MYDNAYQLQITAAECLTPSNKRLIIGLIRANRYALLVLGHRWLYRRRNLRFIKTGAAFYRPTVNKKIISGLLGRIAGCMVVNNRNGQVRSRFMLMSNEIFDVSVFAGAVSW